MANTDETAREGLAYLNRLIEDAVAACDKRMATSREYWNGKPRTLLNDQLSRIEMEKHRAQYILETAPVRAEREVLLDALVQIAMTKPFPGIVVPQNL